VVCIVSRLTERKGVGLMCTVIPAICKKYPNVIFKIGLIFVLVLARYIFALSFPLGGDGDRRFMLEEMITNCNLKDSRVFTYGNIPHPKVRDVF
jgi:glycosyltransferase involved in cell wall biosynthesis